MNNEQLAAIELRLKKANDIMTQLCSGGQRWTMSIPADPERDPDIIIGNALHDIANLIGEVRRLPRSSAHTEDLERRAYKKGVDDERERIVVACYESL